jgi:hypothetical protein
MDLTQTKLSRTEWNSTEIPIAKSEHDVLSMLIHAAAGDINIRVNHTQSIVSFLKIAKDDKSAMEKIDAYIYSTYLAPACRHVETALKGESGQKEKEKEKGKVHLNSADRIRMEKVTKESLQSLFEFVLLEHMLPLVPLLVPLTEATVRVHFHAFTLMNLLTASVQHVNPMLSQLAAQLVLAWTPHLSKQVIVKHAVEFIERNKQLFLYEDLRLYDHQKKLFVLCRSDTPKLIFNIAPTGTGKTMTAIALTEIASSTTGRKKRVLFVCSARHVGLALTRSAISVGKRVAMAFGCESADDIRLHYLAAKEYTVNKRSGRIAKVDNSIGDNVEIMVCDTKSFCVAQQYMIAFFDADELIQYWDEPTIFMDYADHEMHGIIHHNWCENRIPIVVLSSATLPKPEELTEVTADFKNRFTSAAAVAEIHSIVTNDCRKSIPIIDTDGFAVVPHRLCGSAEEARVMCAHCENTPTLLRYFDLHEIVAFIGLIKNDPMELDRHFDSMLDITMHSVKMFYLAKLASLSDAEFVRVTTVLCRIQLPRILKNERGEINEKSKSMDSSYSSSSASSLAKPGMPLVRTETVANNHQKPVVVGTSGIFVTTKDAYTLTDGPSIFIADDVDKIAAFYVQQARIPSIVMQDLMHKIAINNEINKRMNVIELDLERMDKQIQSKCANVLAGRNKSSKDNSSRIYNRNDDAKDEGGNASSKMTESINALRSTLKSVELNDSFVPNRLMHLNKWAPESLLHSSSSAFTSNIDESTVTEIMGIHGIDDMWKILLMMGIGVLSVSVNKTYTEIMKRLSDAQKLILLIATSDYIYGTNYAYCHGFMSKDLDLTQEKLIQAMGRIGRNNIQQTFTIRFRDNAQIARIFTADARKPEIVNMNRLLSS